MKSAFKIIFAALFMTLYKSCQVSINSTRKGPAQARVSTNIFHDGLKTETCSDTRITLAQYPIILAVHSVHFANFLRLLTLRNDSKCLN